MNNLHFILVQVIGIIAWLMLVLSYYRKNTNKILVFQIIGTILYCIHYGLLGAWSGLFICAFETIFDYGYYKTDKDKYIYISSIPIRIAGGLIGFKSFIDILPICASLIDGYTLTKKKRVVVFGAIISYTLWVIYDIFVMSYSGAITDGIIVLSNISILLFNYDIFTRKKES
ncbi:MAG: YgjV family protein [Bacilli bacterium]|nr:YgjV family protein [Bacilli bacterium]